MDNTVTFEDFRNEYLVEVRAGNPSSTVLGNRFSRKLLSDWLDIDMSSDDLIHCDGARDGGIDLAYLARTEGGNGVASAEGEEPAGDTWYLVQSKYGTAFRGTGTLLDESQKLIDTVDGRNDNLSSLSREVTERLAHFRQRASEHDRIVLVFATEEPLNEGASRALQDILAMGRGRFGTLFDVQSVSIETIYRDTLEEMAEAARSRMRLSLKAELSSSGGSLLVGATPLNALYAFLKNFKARADGDLDRLYERNVRRFLGSKGRVNKNMRVTLNEEPERFGLYNNGITIVVSDFERGAGDETVLVEPFIVNGCQTTRTIWEVLQSKLESGGTGTDPDLEEWQERLSQGVVVTKVVRVGSDGEELLHNITRNTNRQNPVSEKDFLALSRDFRAWKSQMAERHGIYLEIQRGGWDSQRALQRQNPSVRQFSEAANAFNLIKTYGAGWLREAGAAFGKNKPFLPGGRVFETVTTGEGQIGVDDLYAAYRMQRYADDYGFGRGAEQASRRQTRFLFYMVVMELLREVLVREEITQRPEPRELTHAFLELSGENNEAPLSTLLNESVEAVDEYMNPGTEDSVIKEPAYQDRFGHDLNAYLKWDLIGKTEEASPRFRDLLSMHRRLLGRPAGSQPSPRSIIAEALR